MKLINLLRRFWTWLLLACFRVNLNFIRDRSCQARISGQRASCASKQMADVWARPSDLVPGSRPRCFVDSFGLQSACSTDAGMESSGCSTWRLCCPICGSKFRAQSVLVFTRALGASWVLEFCLGSYACPAVGMLRGWHCCCVGSTTTCNDALNH